MFGADVSLHFSPSVARPKAEGSDAGSSQALTKLPKSARQSGSRESFKANVMGEAQKWEFQREPW